MERKSSALFYVYFPSRVCIEVFVSICFCKQVVVHVFVSCLTIFKKIFHTMHVKFYNHENLTATGNFYKNFPCRIQNLNAADIFQTVQNFSWSV